MSKGENIRKLRKDKGLTQKQLGDLCGIDEANIRRYELGNANPKLETVRKIATALDVYLADIVGNEWGDFSQYEIRKDWLIYPSKDIEDKLSIIGYSIGAIESEGYLWINYPDGSLEITEEDLKTLDQETDEYLKFRLDQLKQQRIKDFKKK